jgi:hypothetical protein
MNTSTLSTSTELLEAREKSVYVDEASQKTFSVPPRLRPPPTAPACPASRQAAAARRTCNPKTGSGSRLGCGMQARWRAETRRARVSRWDRCFTDDEWRVSIRHLSREMPMPELPPTSVKPPTDPDEPGGTGVPEGTPTPFHAPGSLPFEAGTLIGGRYKLVKELGEGGMGAVWMAEQSEPVRRLVAVKLIRTGMDDREFRYRFEAERQALSLMDHPNIARVFDAGTHAGRPFFVMELVKGTPITKYCDDKKLTPRQRLELFVPVCNAIQHAHQKGIIHRDIKPNNVLVSVHDDKPVPKVIDFGVAKATGQPLSERTMHTLGIVGTPEYMSPRAGHARPARHRHPFRCLFPRRAALRNADRHNSREGGGHQAEGARRNPEHGAGSGSPAAEHVSEHFGHITGRRGRSRHGARPTYEGTPR